MIITEKTFLADVANHEMTILHEQGLYRHVRFKEPGTGIMHFDLITWPGHLAYSGDMGSYVFSRLPDMFNFFKEKPKLSEKQERELVINPSYWAEKLQSIDRNGVTQFSESLFKAAVMSRLVSWIRDNVHRTTQAERRELWNSVIYEVVEADFDSLGSRKTTAAMDFSHRVNADCRSFEFYDFWEEDTVEYTNTFMWCCYAIAWGVKLFDLEKSKTSV